MMGDGPSAQARGRMLSRYGEPLFLSAWERVLMIHLEADAAAVQHDVPFPLDLWEGRAFISLVAFTLARLRPRALGSIGSWMFRPLAKHTFLNLRTYVIVNAEPGIHFLAEWVSSPLAVKLGPATFGLPYRPAHIAYEHDSYDWQLARQRSGSGHRARAPLPGYDFPAGSLPCLHARFAGALADGAIHGIQPPETTTDILPSVAPGLAAAPRRRNPGRLLAVRVRMAVDAECRDARRKLFFRISGHLAGMAASLSQSDPRTWGLVRGRAPNSIRTQSIS